MLKVVVGAPGVRCSLHGVGWDGAGGNIFGGAGVSRRATVG